MTSPSFGLSHSSHHKSSSRNNERETAIGKNKIIMTMTTTTTTTSAPTGRQTPVRRLVRGLSSLSCISGSTRDLFKCSSHSCEELEDLEGKRPATTPGVADEEELSAPEKKPSNERETPSAKNKIIVTSAPTGRQASMRRLVRGLSSLNCISGSTRDLFKCSSHSREELEDFEGQRPAQGLGGEEQTAAEKSSSPVMESKVRSQNPSVQKEICLETPALLPRRKLPRALPTPSSLRNMNLTLDQVFEQYDQIIAMHASSSSFHLEDFTEGETECEETNEVRVTAISSPKTLSKTMPYSTKRLDNTASPISSPQKKLPAPRRGLNRFCSTSNLYRSSKKGPNRPGLTRQSSMHLSRTVSTTTPEKDQKQSLRPTSEASLTKSEKQLQGLASPVSSPKLKGPAPQRGLSRFRSTSNLYRFSKKGPNRPGLTRQSSMCLNRTLSSTAYKTDQKKPLRQQSDPELKKPENHRRGLVRQNSVHLSGHNDHKPREQKKTPERRAPPRGLSRFCSMSNLVKGSISRGNVPLAKKQDSFRFHSKKKLIAEPSDDKRHQPKHENQEKQALTRTKSLENFVSSYEAIVAPGFHPTQEGETLTGW